MTWSRYLELHEHWKSDPPPESLLAFIASAYGYKPPRPSVSGEKAARELRDMFPGGVIRGSQS